MSFTIPTAYAGSEREYRQQRVKAGFAAQPARSRRRTRLTAVFRPHRRTSAGLRRPMPAPHH